MKIDVVPLPRMLTDEHVRDRVVVVFDVLRATTTIAAALAAEAKEIRVFDSLEAAREGSSEFTEPKLLCGESKCLPPPGFDLGNSPGAYVASLVQEKTLFLSTTNGTRALVAARDAAFLFTGALVNASAVGMTISKLGRPITLLCAGTDGEEAPEDFLGAGAVISEMPDQSSLDLSELAEDAVELFGRLRGSHFTESRLLTFLHATQGGRNVVQAGLGDDVAFAARANAFDVVPACDGSCLSIRKYAE
jgi:2-phosphosulfolactate phosphatase